MRWGHVPEAGPPAIEAFCQKFALVHAGVMARDNRQFAKFSDIDLDGAGEPDADDLRPAWAAGARAIRLSPR